MRTLQIAAIALLIAPAAARADAPDVVLHVDPEISDCEVHFAPELTQSSFRRFTREFGSVSAFKQMGSSKPLGQWQVALGLEYLTFQVDEESDAWNDTFSHPTDTHYLGSSKDFPKLKLRVGVGHDTDVGVFYTMNPEANYGWLGVDAKHALLRQIADQPMTVAVRAAYTKTLFVGDMDMHALTADVSVDRTFAKRLTPYLGVGGDVVLARETAAMVELDDELAFTPHAFAGVEVALWRLVLGAEAQVATISSAQLQLAATF